MKEWKETVIETDIDKLLEYLAKEGKAPVDKISKDLDIPKDRINTWAKALEKDDLLEREYTARKGTVLEFTEKSKNELEGKSDEVKENIDEKIKEVEENMDSSSEEVNEVKKQLEKLGRIIKKDKKESEVVEEELKRLKEEEEEIEDQIEEEEGKEEKLEEEIEKALSKINTSLEKIEEAEEDTEKFSSLRRDINSDLEVLKNLRKQNAKIEKIKNKFGEIEPKEEKALKLTMKIKSLLSSIFSRGYKCEICGDQFSSEKGLKIHKSKVHGD